ncbi:hypothetical protein J7355_08515 [Endozoicomonas sp. G2_2]|uniref:hypothetical protein n=1 Tax=Endozoicomonas sp. G2_2 TaxID=2821092 RepID=UPI001ADD1486|nr:hypothetical protein [Endozoicomonas sp. G2_2]MBO9470141.1 hypothetical protein [Endozoicomonas sp. G2_2]
MFNAAICDDGPGAVQKLKDRLQYIQFATTEYIDLVTNEIIREYGYSVLARRACFRHLLAKMMGNSFLPNFIEA